MLNKKNMLIQILNIVLILFCLSLFLKYLLKQEKKIWDKVLDIFFSSSSNETHVAGCIFYCRLKVFPQDQPTV